MGLQMFSCAPPRSSGYAASGYADEYDACLVGLALLLFSIGRRGVRFVTLPCTSDAWSSHRQCLTPGQVHSGHTALLG